MLEKQFLSLQETDVVVIWRLFFFLKKKFSFQQRVFESLCASCVFDAMMLDRGNSIAIYIKNTRLR